jgi:DNA-binding IclR family transcriptional regulator
MDSRAFGTAPAYPIASVDRALRVLAMLARQRTVRLVDASRELNVARSTAHRLMRMLQHHGLAMQDHGSRTYVAGPTLIELGLSAVRQVDIRAVARPCLEDLVREVEETAHLAILSDTNCLFIDSVESPRALRIGGRTGVSLPAHSTAAGKAVLAELDAAELEALYRNLPLTGVTPRTHTSRTALEADLAAVRKLGYATNFEESEAGVTAIAAAIRPRSSRALGAVTLSLPTSRFTPASVKPLAARVCHAAAEISRRLSRLR